MYSLHVYIYCDFDMYRLMRNGNHNKSGKRIKINNINWDEINHGKDIEFSDNNIVLNNEYSWNMASLNYNISSNKVKSFEWEMKILETGYMMFGFIISPITSNIDNFDYCFGCGGNNYKKQYGISIYGDGVLYGYGGKYKNGTYISNIKHKPNCNDIIKFKVNYIKNDVKLYINNKFMNLFWNDINMNITPTICIKLGTKVQLLSCYYTPK